MGRGSAGQDVADETVDQSRVGTPLQTREPQREHRPSAAKGGRGIRHGIERSGVTQRREARIRGLDEVPARIRERAVEGWDRFEGHSPHRPWVDEVKISCERCGGRSSRIPDVGNPWLDAGIVTYSTVRYNTDRTYWKKWIPADLVLESFPGQFRNWFYSLLAMATVLENSPPFLTCFGYATLTDEQGRVQYTDTPCGESATSIRKQTAPASPAATQ